MARISAQIIDLLRAVYAEDDAQAIAQQLAERLAGYAAADAETQERLTERDVILITYGDQIQEPDVPPLQTLDATLQELIGGIINGVHILPFYPYTSDDGFSVVDYKQVNPELGTWADVRQTGTHFRLMFDAVINHISQESDWFQRFKQGEEPYVHFFVVVDPDTDLSQVVRPRTLPLLTPVDTVDGVKHVWTTFSADQIDINYASPDLLLAVLDVLLFYVEQGAQLIRLDAIGFMWKEIGTSCIHLPQAHALIRLMRALLDQVAPHVLLVTETNVPHAENVSYFGDGYNEAQMVYNFTLPPLTLYAFMTGNATHLSRWAATLTTPSDQTTFFNFMASHDGVGLRPLEGILPAEEVQRMADQTLAHGGLVSYKTNSDGSQSPYELNIVYFDALSDPNADEPQARQVDRFMASQAILLSMPGVPGIYVHSLFGSRNWRDGVAQTGHNRTINRRKFRRAELEAVLADPASVPHQVFTRYKQLIRARTAQAAFHPNAGRQVLDVHPALFALLRTTPDGAQRILCLHNVSDAPVAVTLDLAPLGLDDASAFVDLIDGMHVVGNARNLSLHVPAYGVLWLRAES